MFETDLQKVIYLSNYAKYDPALGRRETWEETTTRVMVYLRKTATREYREQLSIDWDALSTAMLRLEVLPSMRVIQMAGPALDRCNVGAYNCAYLPLKDWDSLGELLYILMQGTGVGFSVENQYINELPIIEKQTGQKILFIIGDSTEGWCDAFTFGLKTWANGSDVEYDYSAIRPYGAPLLTKGGKSSGPQPLKDLLDFSRIMMLKHQGRKLSSLNVHDLACYCGSIVQVGGVRRAAEISLSDLNDVKMRNAKSGQFWTTAPERAMANNSAVYEQTPSTLEFIEEWVALMKSGTGERGIFNREGIMSSLPACRDPNFRFGINPCGEIILRPYEFCNLSIAVARPYDDMGTLIRKVRQATQFGMVQSLLTNFNYIRDDWRNNCESERLLGVDITGQMDNPILNGSTMYKPDHVYQTLKSHVLTEAKRLAKELNINLPAAMTCVKPSGNSSQLLGVSSGIHPRFSRFYIRRIRLSSNSPVSQLLIKSGVPHHPEVGQPPDSPSIWVFEFPVKSPDDAKVRSELSAIDQLNNWQRCKLNWAEHSVSCTVYVKEDEWLEVGAWVQKNWSTISGVSFLPYGGGVYQLAPYEEITEEQYYKLLGEWPKIDFGSLTETQDNTDFNREFACTGDKCEL